MAKLRNHSATTVFMFILSQRAIRTFLLMVFCAVSAVGHGLHYLPGVTEHGICQNGIGEPSCTHCCQNSGGLSSEETGGQDNHESGDDCSVCRVLSQSIDLVEPVEPPASSFFIFCDPPTSSSRLNLFVGDCRSRGPPAAGEILV